MMLSRPEEARPRPQVVKARPRPQVIRAAPRTRPQVIRSRQELFDHKAGQGQSFKKDVTMPRNRPSTPWLKTTHTVIDANISKWLWGWIFLKKLRPFLNTVRRTLKETEKLFTHLIFPISSRNKCFNTMQCYKNLNYSNICGDGFLTLGAVALTKSAHMHKVKDSRCSALFTKYLKITV